MLSELYTALQEVTVFSVVLCLALAVIAGGIIGLERGSKRRAALVIITNQYIAGTFHTSDPAYLGAQVISGIGFMRAHPCQIQVYRAGCGVGLGHQAQ